MAACPTCHQPATTRDGFDRPGVPSLNLEPPSPKPPKSGGSISVRPVLAGLHHVYERELDRVLPSSTASCMVDRMLTEFAVALQRIARAAGFVVGFPKVQCYFGLIAANAGDFQGGVDLHRQLAASLGNSKGLIVTPAASCFGAFTIGAADWGAPTDEALSSRFRDSTRFMLELMTDHLEFARSDELSVGFRKYVRPQLALRNNHSIALPASRVF